MINSYIKTFLVYGFRKNQGCKISFPVTVELNGNNGEDQGRIIKAIRKEGKQLNKEHKYYCSEKMVIFKTDGIIIKA